MHGCAKVCSCVVQRPDQVTDLDENDNKEGEEGGEKEEGPSVFLRRDGESADAYAARIFRRVFTEDIENVLTMEVAFHPSEFSLAGLCSSEMTIGMLITDC